jgi:hypothetical protein
VNGTITTNSLSAIGNSLSLIANPSNGAAASIFSFAGAIGMSIVPQTSWSTGQQVLISLGDANHSINVINATGMYISDNVGMFLGSPSTTITPALDPGTTWLTGTTALLKLGDSAHFVKAINGTGMAIGDTSNMYITTPTCTLTPASLGANWTTGNSAVLNLGDSSHFVKAIDGTGIQISATEGIFINKLTVACHISNTSTQGPFSLSSTTQITFGTTVFDYSIGGTLTSTNANAITVPTAGTYLVTFATNAGNPGGGVGVVTINKNSSAWSQSSNNVIGSAIQTQSASIGGQVNIQIVVSGQVRLAAGDILRCWFSQGTGNQWTIGNSAGPNTYFTASFISQ